MIPWFPGGHCDPWNHVESAMALDVAGLHARGRATPTSGWPTCSAPTAAGTTTTGPTAASRRPSSTPTCAPTSPPACGTTGAARGTGPSSTTCGRPSSGRSTGCCRMRRPDGLVLWAVEADGTRRGTTPCSPARRASTTPCAAASPSPTSSASRSPEWARGRRRDGRTRSPTGPRRSSRRSAGRWTGTTRC